MFKVKYHDNIKHCPLGKFIDAVDEGNIKGLKKSGYIHSVKRANEAADELQKQFEKATGSGGMSTIFLRERNLLYLKFRYDVLMVAYNSFCLRYNLDLARKIKRLGVNVGGQLWDYETDKKRIYGKLKLWSSEIEEKENEIREIVKDKSGGSFTKTLTLLSKYQGYRIDSETTTVEEFCEILLNFEKEQKEIQRKWQQEK